MKSQTLTLGLLLSLLAPASCSSSSPASSSGGSTGGGDAGSDAGEEAGAPLRTATTRALLATSVENLLLDPFVTTDTSLGHFVGVVLPISGTNYQLYTPDRSFVSQAPAGVAAPVAIVALSASDGSPLPATGVQIVAPFPGGTPLFSAQVWASVGDAKGNPVSFATGGNVLEVSLLSNDASQPAYPLTVSGSPVELDGRQWVLLALAAPVAMPQGGWFSIVLDDIDATFQLQAPQVTPAGAPAVGGMRTTPRTERDRRVLEAYPVLTHRPSRNMRRSR